MLQSCSVTRTLDPGEELYTGADVQMENSGFFEDRSLKGTLEDVTVPEPNAWTLGMAPLKLWMYNLAGDSISGKGLRYWLKYKAGEPPVLWEPYYKTRSLNNMKNKLFGKGYFDALVTGEKKISGKKVSMQYEVTKRSQYTIDTIIYQKRAGQEDVPFEIFKEESVLQKDAPYDIDLLLEERNRISEHLQDSGYYYFNANYLVYKIDSSHAKKSMKLYMTLKNNIPPHALKKYQIGSVHVYPDYSLQADEDVYDSSQLKDITYHSRMGLVEHDILDRSIMLRKGDYYSDAEYTATLNKLMGLGIFKFANIRFNRDTTTAEADLNMDIFLTQQIPKSLRLEMQAVTKSNDYSGPYLYLTYLNRNTFRRAEELKVDLSGGFESQWTNDEMSSFSYEFGADVSLSFPRFIFPYIDFGKYLSKAYTPTTTIKTGYSLVNRVEYYTTNSFDISYGYNWQETREKHHKFDIISINYSNLLRTTSDFDTILENNPILSESFDEKFIFSINYEYSYNNKVQEDRDFYTQLLFSTEIAGNTANLADNLVHGKGSSKNGTLFGIDYSQFAKGTADLRNTYKLSKEVDLASRVIVGLAYPYGNSNTLPYSRQYFIGGANSLRGFHYRSLGPGRFNPEDEGRFLFSHNGDIKLEGNVELRFPLAGSFKGALFADAGNVWMWSASEERPGAKFNLNTFSDELALNTGLGFRFDLSFFVLRFDLGVPLRTPYQSNGSHWIRPKFFQSAWWSEYPVFNIAIGYPF